MRFWRENIYVHQQARLIRNGYLALMKTLWLTKEIDYPQKMWKWLHFLGKIRIFLKNWFKNNNNIKFKNLFNKFLLLYIFIEKKIITKSEPESEPAKKNAGLTGNRQKKI